jgi:hypothetical protein
MMKGEREREGKKNEKNGLPGFIPPILSEFK